MSQNFAPWKQDRSRGIKSLLWATASGAGAVLFAINGNAPFALGLGLISVALTGMSSSSFRKASNREFGKKFEHDCTQAALSELARRHIRVEANVMVKGLGDIDLVAYVGGTPVPVEIKSFRIWNQFLFFNGKREARTIAQAGRQKSRLKADIAFVWLPQGRPTMLQRFFGAGGSRDIKVIFGSEKVLADALARSA